MQTGRGRNCRVPLKKNRGQRVLLDTMVAWLLSNNLKGVKKQENDQEIYSVNIKFEK